MTRRGPVVVQKVWDRKARVFRHRLVRQMIRCKAGRKRKPTSAELLFARA